MIPLIVLLYGLLLTGCASTNTTATLTERDDGGDTRMTVGQALFVKLEGNLSTGYE